MSAATVANCLAKEGYGAAARWMLLCVQRPQSVVLRTAEGGSAGVCARHGQPGQTSALVILNAANHWLMQPVGFIVGLVERCSPGPNVGLQLPRRRRGRSGPSGTVGCRVAPLVAESQGTVKCSPVAVRRTRRPRPSGPQSAMRCGLGRYCFCVGWRRR